MQIRIAIITGNRIGTNREGGAGGRILQGIITDEHDVQNIQTCSAGEEFNAPNGCTAIVVEGGAAYKVAAVMDDGIAPLMEPGGKRIYSVDATGAAEVAEVRLRPDGTVSVFNENAAITVSPAGEVTVANDAASFTMSAAGEFTFHGVSSHFDHPVTMAQTLDVTGAVTSDDSMTAPTVEGTTDVIFATKSAKDHKHVSGSVGTQTSTPV